MPTPFSVATYNVLADAYVLPERYPQASPDLLVPARRRAAVVERARGLGADIICFQELEAEVFAELATALGPEYKGRYASKAGKPDGCGTFVKCAVFEERATRTLRYTDSSGHIALILVLAQEATLLGVANTHLKWDAPATPLMQRHGYRQASELLEACLVAEGAVPWIVCGDFNVVPDDPILRLFDRRGLRCAFTGMQEVRTCYANRRARKIDYLLHTAALEVQRALPPTLDDHTPLPSGREPSDHLPLVAQLKWR